MTIGEKKKNTLPVSCFRLDLFVKEFGEKAYVAVRTMGVFFSFFSSNEADCTLKLRGISDRKLSGIVYAFVVL